MSFTDFRREIKGIRSQWQRSFKNFDQSKWNEARGWSGEFFSYVFG